jgi:bifunctional DNA-binding transcriptional regulator/antitoxin component of YhaV-PrlF toxin-antitoxin module
MEEFMVANLIVPQYNNYMQTTTIHQESWLKVQQKGTVALPQKWREEMGIVPGDRIRAKKIGDRLVLEITSTKSLAPYRVYTDDEIEVFLQEDVLPSSLANKVERRFASIF